MRGGDLGTVEEGGVLPHLAALDMIGEVSRCNS